MMQEVLTISVKITGQDRVAGAVGDAGMVYFTGEVDCENFKGRILPGGVDTQRNNGSHITISARYMLEGTDGDGAPCHIFIENNGVISPSGEITRTVPTVVTDSPRLKWLETAQLSGTLEPKGEMAVLIHIFAEKPMTVQ